MIADLQDVKPVFAFVDMHAHSKKKSIFIYGGYYPLHNEKYFKLRVIAKLLSENSDMFRYYSSKFRNEKSKQKAARLVVCKEFDIMNSFTFETSFHGYLHADRTTVVFEEDNLRDLG